eukprot:gene23589-biopygen14881
MVRHALFARNKTQHSPVADEWARDHVKMKAAARKRRSLITMCRDFAACFDNDAVPPAAVLQISLCRPRCAAQRAVRRAARQYAVEPACAYPHLLEQCCCRHPHRCRCWLPRDWAPVQLIETAPQGGQDKSLPCACVSPQGDGSHKRRARANKRHTRAHPREQTGHLNGTCAHGHIPGSHGNTRAHTGTHGFTWARAHHIRAHSREQTGQRTWEHVRQ